MKLINRARGAGKTTELINLAHNKKAYIVCISQEECARVASLARRLGKNIFFPITYEEYIHYRGYPMEFFLDNPDAYLKEKLAGLFRRPVSAAAFENDSLYIPALFPQTPEFKTNNTDLKEQTLPELSQEEFNKSVQQTFDVGRADGRIPKEKGQ